MLVGGLGMGYKLRAALDALPAKAGVFVAELVPVAIEWNLGPLGPLAGYPLSDPRLTMQVAEVGVVVRSGWPGAIGDPMHTIFVGRKPSPRA